MYEVKPLKKVYVKSGTLEWVGFATGPLDAVIRAMKECGNGKTLDGHCFFIDERGFRERDAEFRVPMSKGLKAAGFVFDDPSDAKD